MSETPKVKKHLLRKRMVWVNTFFIVLLSAISYNLYQNYKDNPAEGLAFTDNQDKSIAILPFKNLSDDAENQYFTDGVSASIQNNLSSISDLKVIPATSMEKYQNSNLTASQIADEVNVIYLLEGSVQKHNDSIRIFTNLVNGRNNEQLHSFVFDWEYKNIFEIQSTIAIEIAKQLDLTIDPEKIETNKKQPTENLEAYNAYLKGRFLWHKRNKEALEKSILYFEKAIALDTIYSQAYTGLADTYYVLGTHDHENFKEHYSKAKYYVKKALSLDKNMSEAHTTLAGLLFHCDWDFKEAEKEFKTAITLNPNYDVAHYWYSELLTALDRREEANYHLDYALELNPNSWVMNISKGILDFSEGNFYKAIEVNNRAKEMNKLGFWLYWVNFESYHQLGKHEKAVTELVEIYERELNFEMSVGVKEAFNSKGIKGIYEFINVKNIESGFANFVPHQMAHNYVFLGKNEKALEWLEFGLEQHHPEMVFVLRDPYFDILKNEPRFKAILKQIGLNSY